MRGLYGVVFNKRYQSLKLIWIDVKNKKKPHNLRGFYIYIVVVNLLYLLSHDFLYLLIPKQYEKLNGFYFLVSRN